MDESRPRLSALPAREPLDARVGEVLEEVAARGSWHAPVSSLQLDDVPAFRSALRRAGRAASIRIRTHLVNGTLIVEWPEWQPTPAQEAARAEVIRNLFTDHPVTYDEALERARRRLIHEAGE